MTVVASVKDIQPNAAKPTLELSFPGPDRASHPVGTRSPIVLEIGDVTWHGTLANKGDRPPYVHTHLTMQGRRSTCTELLLGLGLAEGARLSFRVEESGHYRLERVLEPGRWREGNQPHERKDRRRDRSAKGPTRASPSAPLEPLVRERPSSFPFDDRAEILRLADLYWSLISARDAVEERSFEDAISLARLNCTLSKELFVRLARWKSVRNTAHYEANSERAVARASAIVFEANQDSEAINALTALRGVALRTASALLHWMRPERFPVLDYRVVGALGLSEPQSYEDVDFYKEVADRVRDLARRHSLDLRTIDRALWAWDKMRS